MSTLYEQISNRRGGGSKKKKSETIDLTVDTPPQKKKQKNSSFQIGSNVILQHLIKGSQYNGKRGTIQTDEDISSGRQNVLLDGGNKVVSVKPENMKQVDSSQKKQKSKSAATGKKSKKVTYDEKAYLNVPFDEKDEAKELGAWWDPKRKQWYVRPNKDVTPFAHWNPTPDDGKCLGCGEFIEEHESHEGEEYKCGFCDRDICGKCLPFSEEGSWRCLARE